MTDDTKPAPQEPVAWRDVHDQTNLYYRKPEQVECEPLYLAQAPSDCVTNPLSSRICERGTHSCVKEHTAPQEPLSDERIIDRAHRKATRFKMVDEALDGRTTYKFDESALLDFARSILSESPAAPQSAPAPQEPHSIPADHKSAPIQKRDKPKPAATQEPRSVPLPLEDAQMLLSWMDTTFGNKHGNDWHDADAAAVGDALDEAIENFKRRHAVAASPAAPQPDTTDLRALLGEAREALSGLCRNFPSESSSRVRTEKVVARINAVLEQQQ